MKLTKNDLRAYRDEADELRDLERRIDRIKTRLYTLHSAPITGMPIAHSSSSGSAQERAADQYTERLEALEADYEKRRDALLEHCRAIENGIDALPSRFRVIFRSYYIDGLKWEDVAELHYMSLSTVERLHRQGLEKLTLNDG